MTLSWNEIKGHAIQFSREWEQTVREEADAKPFWVEFFSVFGIKAGASLRLSTALRSRTIPMAT